MQDLCTGGLPSGRAGRTLAIKHLVHLAVLTIAQSSHTCGSALMRSAVAVKSGRAVRKTASHFTLLGSGQQSRAQMFFLQKSTQLNDRAPSPPKSDMYAAACMPPKSYFSPMGGPIPSSMHDLTTLKGFYTWLFEQAIQHPPCSPHLLRKQSSTALEVTPPPSKSFKTRRRAL